jgi:hypothetical protein
MGDIQCRRFHDNQKSGVPVPSFYGALKSENERYYLIASVFREASRGDARMAGDWIHQMVTAGLQGPVR